MKYNQAINNFILKWGFVIALLFATVILAVQGCKKGDNPAAQLYEEYFEENVLNSNFVVQLATDNGTDNTSLYSGWVFRLLKNTYYDGPMTAVKNGTTYTGTWSCDQSYGRLTINISQPSVPADFGFINKAWRFTKKDLPVMELAPWGNNLPQVLHMRRL
ncbi:MAG: hypothetical protein EOO13_03420 [Chitinophagaceae bacterium]|nr:MAG: hypothetical protein EOO13_03420 [Chitinophagaceae bacterium]